MLSAAIRSSKVCPAFSSVIVVVSVVVVVGLQKRSTARATATTRNIHTMTKTKVKTAATTTTTTAKAPKGRPISGKTWRGERKRASAMIAVKELRPGYGARQEVRRRDRVVKEQEREIKAKVKAEKEARRLAREAQEKRRQENAKKSEVVQIITNTKKLKRLTKRQMRNIRPLLDTSRLEKK
jgi:rRNA-processing protein CGR1